MKNNLKGIKPQKSYSLHGIMLSDIIEAAIKNIELSIENSGSKHLLTDFAIPQLRSVIDRLKV